MALMAKLTLIKSRRCNFKNSSKKYSRIYKQYSFVCLYVFIL